MSHSPPDSGTASPDDNRIDPTAISDADIEPVTLDAAPEPPECPSIDCNATMAGAQSQGSNHRIQRTFQCPDCDSRTTTIVHKWGPLSELATKRLARQRRRFPARFSPVTVAGGINEHARDGRYRIDQIGPHHLLVTLPTDIDYETFQHLTAVCDESGIDLASTPNLGWLSIVDARWDSAPLVDIATDQPDGTDADHPRADGGTAVTTADTTPKPGTASPAPSTRSDDVATTPGTGRVRVDVDRPWFIGGDPDSGFELRECPSSPADHTDRSPPTASDASADVLSLPTGNDEDTFAIDAARTERALTEAMIVTLAESGGIYEVDSSSGNTYRVDLLDGECSCPDREPICKHLRRVAIALRARRSPAPDGSLP